MTETVHLEVIKGEDTGKTFSVPADGARIGRSSKNDIVLADPLMSRHHSRVYLKDGALWITDLGSANETLVNDKGITDVALQVNDRIQLGDSVLKVINAGTAAAVAAEPQKQPTAAATTTPLVNLGFDGNEPEPPATSADKKPRQLISKKVLIAALAAVVILALGAWIPQLLKPADSRPDARPPETTQQPARRTRVLEVNYEKVEANPQSIFRYALTISADGILAVQIDDLANDRHVRKETRLNPEYIQQLAAEFENSGFFSLQEIYQGVRPDILDAWDLAITIDRRTHRTRVINRVEPDIFRDVRETIENAGKNELGLWAVQFSTETLLALAEESYLLGKKLYDERMVKDENLAMAIKAFNEADWYLETIEPKPDYYADIVSSLRRCRTELESRYEDHNFRARRAIQLRDWREAAQELRTIMALIPDREDDRYREARRNLLDVERRIELER